MTNQDADPAHPGRHTTDQEEASGNGHRATVSASGTLALCHHLLDQQRVSAARLEACLGFTLNELERPDTRVAVERHHALWELAVQVTGNPALGLQLGSRVEPDRMGLVGHILFNASTLAEALRHYVRLQRLVNEAQYLELDVNQDEAVLRWHSYPTSGYCVADMDRTLAAAVTRARHFIHPQLKLKRVDLPHDEPGYTQAYQALLTCPVHFNQPNAALYFDARYLNYHLPARNPYLYDALLKQVNGLLNRLQPRRTLQRRVRKLIRARLSSGQVDADSIAQDLHISRQTLYRRLKQEDCSFQDLVDNVRQSKAQRYVLEGHYALSEVAFLLGFSELSAFSRAFKRWTGESPQHYREREQRIRQKGAGMPPAER